MRNCPVRATGAADAGYPGAGAALTAAGSAHIHPTPDAAATAAAALPETLRPA